MLTSLIINENSTLVRPPSSNHGDTDDPKLLTWLLIDPADNSPVSAQFMSVL